MPGGYAWASAAFEVLCPAGRGAASVYQNGGPESWKESSSRRKGDMTPVPSFYAGTSTWLV